MVYLDQINNHYKNIGLKVLAINVNNPKIVNKVKPYVKKRNFKFDVAIDPEAKIGSALKVEGLPTTFLLIRMVKYGTESLASELEQKKTILNL